MNILVERIDVPYALCRLPDKDHNLIRLPLRELPQNIAPLDVLTLREDGTLYCDPFAKERRFFQIVRFLDFKKYRPHLKF